MRICKCRNPFDSYRATASEAYFVDKSELLTELIPALGTSQRYFCITRPHRFGKSVMANTMLYQKTDQRFVFVLDEWDSVDARVR